MSSEGVKWEYCPECGSDEIHHEEGDHKQCANCYQEWFADIDYSDVVRKHLSGKYRDKDAVIAGLRAELAALKAASGEEVKLDDDAFYDEFAAWWESDGQYVRSGGGDYERSFAFQAWRYLMPKIAQHQRITAALRGEVEQLKELHGGEHGLPSDGWPVYHKRKMETLRELITGHYERKLKQVEAELDASRKQEPAAVGHIALGSHTGVVFYSHLPQLPDGAKLYAAPPAAAMDGGMVEAVRAIAVRERRYRYEDHNENSPDAWIGQGEINEGIDILNHEIDQLLAAHRQASQQEGE